MMLFGEAYEKSARFAKILRPYLQFVDHKLMYVVDDAPDEVKQVYEEYLEFNKEYEGFG